MPGYPNPGRLCGASAPAGKCRREEGPGFFVGSIRAFQQSGQTAQNETTDEHSPAQPQPKNLTTKTRRRAKFLVAAMPRQVYPRSSVVSLCSLRSRMRTLPGQRGKSFLLPGELDDLQLLWNMTFPAEIRLDLRGEGFAGSRLSMHDESTFRGGAERAQPAKNFARIRMRRKGFHTLDLRPNLHRFSVNLYLPRAVLQELPARSVGLEPYEQDRVSRVRQPVDQMVQDPASGRHAACRDDHAGEAHAVQVLGFFRAVDEMKVGTQHRAGPRVLEHGPGLVIEVRDVVAEEPGHVDCHRAVHINRQVRDPVVRLHLPDDVEQRLSATDREGRDDQASSAPRRLVDNFCQTLLCLLFRMLPVSIGRFHQQVVGVLEGARIAQDLCVVPAQVSGKNDTQWFGSGAQINLNNSRTQNVACVADSEARVLGEDHHLAVIGLAQLRRGLFRVYWSVGGQSRLVLAAALLVRKVRFRLLTV